MKPFDFSHAEQLIGKVIKNKPNTAIFLITTLTNSKLYTQFTEEITYEELLNYYTFLDGTPCGIEEEFNLSFIEVLQIAQNDDRFVSENTKYEFRFSKEKGLTFSSNNPILLVSNILNDKYKKL